MPKSTRTHVKRLRQECRAAAGDMCEFPYCRVPGKELAHLRGKGMGGSAKADTIDNVAWLCKPHHDVLDGRGSKILMETQLRFLGIDYQPGKAGTKFETRTRLKTHVLRARAARRDRRLSQSSAVEGKKGGYVVKTT